MSTLSITDILAPPTVPGTAAQEAAPTDAASAFLSVLDQQLGLLLGTGLVGRGQEQATDATKADPLQYRPANALPVLEGTVLEGGDVAAGVEVAEIIPEMLVEPQPNAEDMALLALEAGVFGAPDAAPEDVAAPEETLPSEVKEAGVSAAAALLLAMPVALPVVDAPKSLALAEGIVADDAAPVDALPDMLVPDALAGEVAGDDAAAIAQAPVSEHADADMPADKMAAKKAESSVPVPDGASERGMDDAAAKEALEAAQAEAARLAMRDARASDRVAALQGQQPAASAPLSDPVVLARAAVRPSQAEAGFQPLSFASLNPAQSAQPVAAEEQGEGTEGEGGSQPGFSSFLANFDTPTKASAAGTTPATQQGFLSYLNAGRSAFGAPPPGEQLLVSVRQMAQQKQTQLTMQLQPAELGRINIRLEFAEGGRVKARVAVERSETLDLLQSDRQGLEQALAAAGFNLDAGGMEFSLQHGQQQAATEGESSRSSFAAGQNMPADSDVIGGDVSTEDALLLDLANGVVNVKI